MLKYEKNNIEENQDAMHPDLLRNFMLTLRKELKYTSAQMGSLVSKSSSAYNSMETGGAKSIPHDYLMTWIDKVREEKEPDTLLNDYVIQRLSVIMNTYSPETLQKEIWLQSLYLENKTINLDGAILNAITERYGTDNWTVILSSLNENPSITRKFVYKQKNVPYVELQNEEEAQELKCPFWCCLYDLSEIEIDKMATDAVNGKINLAVLFTLLLNHSIKNDVCAEDHFTQTCILCYKIGAPVIFNLLDMIKLPKQLNRIEHYTLELLDFVRKMKVSPDDEAMRIFVKNLTEANVFFLNTIATNFTFVRLLSEDERLELSKRITDTTNNFRAEINK